MLAITTHASIREYATRVPSTIEGACLWLLRLDVPAESIPGYRDVLSADERVRADRFRFERDRRRFVVCRALLRHLVGAAAGVACERVAFTYGPFGKPQLDLATDIRLNVSHSDDRALVAITQGAEIGVDIERMNAQIDMESLAGQVFSALEEGRFQEVAPALRVGAFYAGWTRKEAYIKARGDGLQRALDSFDVELAPGRPARLIDVRGEPGEAERWLMASMDVVPGYAAALCVERSAGITRVTEKEQ